MMANAMYSTLAKELRSCEKKNDVVYRVRVYYVHCAYYYCIRNGHNLSLELNGDGVGDLIPPSCSCCIPLCRWYSD